MDIKGNMSDVVLGDHGLVEAKNKKDLKEKMKDAITLLSEMGKHTFKVERRQFSRKL